jgi:hypothetical protein
MRAWTDRTLFSLALVALACGDAEDILPVNTPPNRDEEMEIETNAVGCSALGNACDTEDCPPPFACQLNERGSICVPGSRGREPTSGAARCDAANPCPEAFPSCLVFVSHMTGICVTETELGCACDYDQGRDAFECPQAR